jgi:hypothetical protein
MNASGVGAESSSIVAESSSIAASSPSGRELSTPEAPPSAGIRERSNGTTISHAAATAERNARARMAVG